MNKWGHPISTETVLISDLTLAAIESTRWTRQTGIGKYAIELNNVAWQAWENLKSKGTVSPTINQIVRNKEWEYIQLCILDAYLREIFWSQRYLLSLGTWSADLANCVDARLTVGGKSFLIDFTRNRHQIQNKLNDTSPRNKCDWVVYLQIEDMSSLVTNILDGCSGSYTQQSIVAYIIDNGIYWRTDIDIFDKKTRELPAIFQTMVDV